MHFPLIVITIFTCIATLAMTVVRFAYAVQNKGTCKISGFHYCQSKDGSIYSASHGQKLVPTHPIHVQVIPPKPWKV